MDSELIEKIATDAVKSVGGIAEPGFSTYDAAVRAIEAALAAFEAAQKPTDDEREALVKILATKRMHTNEALGRQRADAEAILAAGFRRPASPEPSECQGCAEDDGRGSHCRVCGKPYKPQTEPTDAQVLAGKEAVGRVAGLKLIRRYTNFTDGWWGDLYAGVARAVLRAALNTKEEGR